MATITSSPGRYVADARFELYWAPDRFLARHLSLWDDLRTLGRPTAYFSPVLGAVLALVRMTATPAFTERLLHASALTVAAIGALAVVRLFRPGVGLVHVLAGLAYAFNPYTSQFLVPSGLFLHYALCPWFVVLVVNGLRRPQRWREPAAIALLLFTLGAINSASLIYSLVPAVVVAAYEVSVARTCRWRNAMTFAARTGALATGTMAAALLIVAFNAPVIAENLRTTELPRLVSSRSSWTESWRGLGSWLSYFRSRDSQARPEAALLFSSLPVVLATFVPSLIALLTVAISRARERIVFAAMAFISLVLMVGIFPVGEGSPLGDAIGWAFEHIPFAVSLRNGYKAGCGLELGVAVLFAIGVSESVTAVRRWGTARARHTAVVQRGLMVSAIAVLALASAPFWTGDLYIHADTTASVPGYWQDAIAWLDAQPTDARALIVPGVNRARFRWGYVGDDIFDALLARRHALRWSLPQGTPEAANLLVAIDSQLTSGRYQPGTLAPIARRLGIGLVVIRNDLDWETMGIPRPAALDSVRADPALHRIATFGRPGENTTAAGEPAVGGETQLPPVEIYNIDGVTTGDRFVSQAPVIVDGDGDAWFQLAGRGMLDSAAPVRYAADTSAADLRQLLEAGSPVVMTDTNRRRISQVRSTRNETSETMAADVLAAVRQPDDLFRRDGSQSVATYGEASSFEASRVGSPFSTYSPDDRPANAFDGVPASAWRVTGDDVVGQWVRADLRSPHRVDHIDLAVAVPAIGGRVVSEASVELSDGTAVAIDLTSGRGSASLHGAETTSITVRITAVSGPGPGPVGFAEVATGLDLAETIQMPDDLVRASATDPATARALVAAPFTVAFDRVLGSGTDEEEIALRRSFSLPDERTFTISGRLRAPDGEAGRPLIQALSSGACVALIELDGQSVGLRSAPASVIVPGADVALDGCTTATLSPGSHRLMTTALGDGALRSITLISNPSGASAPGANRTVALMPTGGADGHTTVPQGPAGYLITDAAYSPAWQGLIGGNRLTAVPLDTKVAFVLPARSSSISIAVEYRGQRAYEVAALVSGGAVGLCLALVAVTRRRRADRTEYPLGVAPVHPSGRSAAAIVIAAALVGFGVAGPPGAAVGALAAWLGRDRPSVPLLGAAATLGGAAVATAFEVALPPSGSFATFVAARSDAAALGRITGVLLAAGVMCVIRSERAAAWVSPAETARLSIAERARAACGLAAGAGAGVALVAALLHDVGPAAGGAALVAVAAFAAPLAPALAERVHPTRDGHLVRGSLWVSVGLLGQAAFGMVFWLAVARLHAAADVGVATALFSSQQFVNYATGLGLQEVLSRFPSTEATGDRSLFGWSVMLTAATSVLGSTAYFWLVPSSARDALLDGHLLLGGAAFVLIAIGTAIALIVDTAFMAHRRWFAVFLRLTIIGALRLPLLLIPAPFDEGLWIFVIMAAPIAISGFVGLPVLRSATSVDVRLRPVPRSWRAAACFGAVSYLSQLALFAPYFVLPVIVLTSVSVTDNGAFYVAWSMAAVATVLPLSVSRVLLVEGARDALALRGLARTAGFLAIGVSVVALALALVAVPLVDLLYGVSYRSTATILPWLVLGGVPWAVVVVVIAAARARAHTAGTVLPTVAVALGVVGAGVALVPEHGIGGAVAAWLIGTGAAMVVAVAVAVRLELGQPAEDPVRSR